MTRDSRSSACRLGAGRITGKRTYSERHTPSFAYEMAIQHYVAL